MGMGNPADQYLFLGPEILGGGHLVDSTGAERSGSRPARGGTLPVVRWTRRLVLAFVLVVILALGGVAAHGPIGPLPGGPLLGELVREPVRDWSFTDAHGEIQVQTRIGILPYSVTTWSLSHQGRLYVPARNGGAKRWVQRVLSDPEARIRIAGKVYPVRFELVTGSEETRPLARVMLAKYLGVEADEARPLSGPTPEGQPRAEVWIFRVESRDAG